MQYRTGLISIVEGSNNVVGVGVDWTDIPADSIFAVPNVAGMYRVLEVVSPTELLLATPWAGKSAISSPYWITADFTPHNGFPLPSRGDLDATRVISEALTMLDAKFVGGGYGRFAIKALQNTPPASPVEGDAYVVGEKPSGPWSARAGELATYRRGQWHFSKPENGTLLYNEAVGAYIAFRKATGSWASNPLTAANWTSIGGKPTAFPAEAHKHDASDIDRGTLGLARIPSIPFTKLSGQIDASQLPSIPASKISGVLDPSQLPPITGGGGGNVVQVNGTLLDLAADMQSKIKEGTIVTTSEGNRWIYSGSGAKTAQASYVQLADITPEWSSIAGKPSAFPTDWGNVSGKPSAFPTTIANVSGLQDALSDAKNGGTRTYANVLLDNGPTASTQITFRKDTAAKYKIINGSDNNLNIQWFDESGNAHNRIVFHSNGATTHRGSVNFAERPTFDSATPWDSKNLNPDTFVAKSGSQVINGHLTLNSPAAYVSLVLNGRPASSKEILFKNIDSNRWGIRTNTTAEGDGDVGQNFEITPYSNDGVSKGYALQINRATRVTNFAATPTVGGNEVWHKGELSAAYGHIAMTPTDNLNDLTRSGYFTQHANAATSLDRNYPVAHAGVLEVFAPSADFVYQRYTTYNAGQNDGGRTFQRQLFGGVWSKWREMVDYDRGGNTFFRQDRIPLFAGEANGAEGGEIRLVKSEGSDWAGNMVMDVQGNHIRFWEQGGGYRGFYLNITKGASGHSEIVHTGNLDGLNIARRNVANTFVGNQRIGGTASQNALTLSTDGNVSNGNHATGAELVINSFQPRILFTDRSTDAKGMLMHFNGSTTGGNFYIRGDSDGDGLYSEVAFQLNLTSKTLHLYGALALTATTGVSQSATNLGRTGNVALISGTRDATWWSNSATGYNVMTNLTNASGSPENNYGYFFKMARRDAENGWVGLWQGHNTEELYYGGTRAGTTMPSWHKVWSSKNFNPIGKLDCAVDGWRNDSAGHPRFWFATDGSSMGRTFIRGKGVEFRAPSDAIRFAVSEWGVVEMAGDVWHKGSGYDAMYFRSSDKVTFLRGENIVFRNTANSTVAEIKADGKLYVNGDIFNGNNTWFRVRGTNCGIHWENHGGGWFMYDSDWMRSYNGKGILTTGAVSMGSFTVTSDRRIKSDFKPIQNHSEIIDATNVYEFTKDKGTANETRQYGVIAQEAQKVVPLLVKPSGAQHTDGSDLLGVDLTGYIPILLEEVKALRIRVAELEKVAA